MEKEQVERLKNALIKKLTRSIKNPDQLKYALLLTEKIKNILLLTEYVDIACNKNALSSKYYERILVLSSKQQFIKPLKYIKLIFCDKNFLNSKNCDEGLRLLEDSTPEDEYKIFFKLMQIIDESNKEKDTEQKARSKNK